MTTRIAARAWLERQNNGPLTLGQLLLSIREGEGASQVDFAARLGLSRSHLCDLEKGRKPISPERAVRLAAILGYSERQFVRLAINAQLARAKLPYVVTRDPAAA